MVRPALPLLFTACVACAPEAVGGDAQATRAPASSAAGFEEAPSAMPGPGRARGGAAAVANADCVRCHEDEAREWSSSRHRSSFSNRAFQGAFAVEPAAFCAECHAPERSSAAARDHELDDLGVGCVTCHLTGDGAVLTGSRQGVGVGAAPHVIERSAAFDGAAACAGCHEFRFPGRPSGAGDEAFMQTTVREHARSPNAARSCASCHMPERSGRRSHAFATVRDPAWLREALDASAAIVAPDSLVVTLAQTAPGHAFPTGDLFRRLEVGAELRGRSGETLVRRVRVLSRRFDATAGTRGRELTGDDRVLFDPATVELDLRPPERSKPFDVVWWVTYQRVAQTFDGRDPARATIESDVPLHRGTLPWRIETP